MQRKFVTDLQELKLKVFLVLRAFQSNQVVTESIWSSDL